MARFTPIRTRALIDLTPAFQLWGKATMAATVLAVLLGFVLLGLSLVVASIAYSYSIVSKLEALGIMFVLSPIISLPVFICSAPFIIPALMRGYGGWLVTVVAGAVAGFTSLLALDGFVWQRDVFTIGLVFGTFFGGLFWACTRLYFPPQTADPKA